MSVEVRILKKPSAEDWLLCKRAALVTVGKTPITPPDILWKYKILKAKHSPIRVLNFAFEITNIPYCNSVHFCRHVHSQPFIKTQRNDRQDEYDRKKAPQDAPVNMIWYMNAEELMTVMEKRLCLLADEDTRHIVEKIRDAVLAECPEFEGLFFPPCAFGSCREMYPCKKGEKR